MPRYKITVSRADYVTRTAGKEWAIINAAGDRGYTPETEKKTWETNEIYEQTVEELDLKQLVAVVNGINGSS